MNQHNLPKLEILYRVLPIKYKNSRGTCFTVDASGKQYIVTAKHVVEGIEDFDEIELGRMDKWVTITVSTIRCMPEAADIIVLSPQRIVTKTLNVVYDIGGHFYGQDVMFLGFPFGFIPQNHPPGHVMPFCKRATVSNIVTNGSVEIIVLAGQSNCGFSGAPIFFSDQRKTQVIGVLTGDTRQLIHEYNLGDEKKAVYESAGFIEGVSINHALEAIKLAPGGAEISDEVE